MFVYTPSDIFSAIVLLIAGIVLLVTLFQHCVLDPIKKGRRK